MPLSRENPMVHQWNGILQDSRREASIIFPLDDCNPLAIPGSFHVFVIAVLSLILACPLLSQSDPPAATGPPSETSAATSSPADRIYVHVQEVNLVLSVTDHRGKFVNGLRPSDLTIIDNGIQQTQLTFFESATDLPVRIALVIDVSASVAYRFDEEKNAIKWFLKAVVEPSDSVMLFAFNQNVQLRSPVTNNWKETARRIQRLNREGETALYDAVLDASQWLASDNSVTRRIMILISDGEENTSKATLDETIIGALKAEASIYSINVSPAKFSEEGKQGTAILKRLAEATGGIYLAVREDDNAGGAFNKIRRELRSQYSLAYKLTNPGARTFHQLQVLVPKQLRVHCRSGYYVK